MDSDQCLLREGTQRHTGPTSASATTQATKPKSHKDMFILTNLIKCAYFIYIYNILILNIIKLHYIVLVSSLCFSHRARGYTRVNKNQTSLAVQWLRLHTSTAGDMGSYPGEALQVAKCGQK